MPLEDFALTTLDVVNGELGFTTGDDTGRDARIERYINVVSDMVRRATNREFYFKSDHVERVPGYGRSRLIVNEHLPISAINSIVFDDGFTTDTIDADDYQIEDAEAGFIENISYDWESTNEAELNFQPTDLPGTSKPHWKVDYNGGWITPKQDDDGVGARDLPYAIEDAVIETVVMRQNRRGQDAGVTSISMADGSIKWATIDGRRVEISTSLERVIQRYKRAVIA